MKLALVLVALISLVALGMSSLRILPARAPSNLGAAPVAAGSCVDHYNSLLNDAKSALARGDRSTTVDLLQQAKNLILACPALQEVQSNTIVSL